ncbi:MAG: aquaporin [Planctomycetia bacterium]|nr:aquaporin [Planctomycetia bacterium]
MISAEAIGTFGLVFAGTAAIVVNSGGAISQVGVALTFGLVVFAMIAAVGDVSGAHLNPAVTFGLYVARRFPGRLVVPYVLSQCAGAVLASLVVRFLFPADVGLGATVPAGPPHQSWVLEVLLTAGLMFVILSVSDDGSGHRIMAGLAIGAVVAVEALFAGPVSGASMNPARSLGPALVSWQLGSLWLYMTAPVIGAALAVPVCRCVRGAGCCSVPARGSP